VDTTCAKCGFEQDGGIFLINENTPYKEGRLAFKYMKPGEAMHFECYIEHCIESAINGAWLIR
jgi:hypothetical protein